MQNIKYLLFYALLLVVVVLGVLKWSWLIIFPVALILTGAVIFIKGNDWRKVMGKDDMNAVLVFVATYLSQLFVSAICFGIGRLIAYFAF